MSTIDFKREGHREIASFGCSYQYGGKYHSAIPFPTEGPLFEIREQLSQEIEGIREMSCLATLYRNGYNHIPWHQDDEEQICQDSDIVCVSLGSPRTLHIRSLSGAKVTFTHPQSHGTGYLFSRACQQNWEHCIPKEIAVKEPRVSLTFRKLSPISGTGTVTPTRIPPVQEPDIPRHPPKRVLILCDSMFSGLHRDFPAGIPGLQVVYRPLYQLTDLEKHSHLFQGTDTVFISAGINDLTRYGHRAWSLMEVVRPMIRRICTEHPGTTFVINSLLETASRTTGQWVNYEVKDMNYGLFGLSDALHNLLFLDTHAEAGGLWCRGRRVLDERHGIHLLPTAKRTLSKSIAIHLTDHLYGGPGRWHGWRLWPLRAELRDIQGYVGDMGHEG